MSNVTRRNRKASDSDIIRLNSLGFSLRSIGRKLGCHPTTITQRLHSLGIAPADTRRNFIEDVFQSLTEDQKAWIESQVSPDFTIRDLVKTLITRNYYVQPTEDRGQYQKAPSC